MSNDKSQNLPKTERTPGPWKQHPVFFTSVYADDKQVAITGGATVDIKNVHEREANAAFIVKACNNHDELIKALNVISDSLLEAIDLLEISEKPAYLERWETERKAAKFLLAQIENDK